MIALERLLIERKCIEVKEMHFNCKEIIIKLKEINFNKENNYIKRNKS